MQRSRIGIGLAVGALGIFLAQGLRGRDADRSAPYPMPDPLYKIVSLVPTTVVKTATSCTFIDWSSRGRFVKVYRKVRLSSDVPWSGMKIQRIETSFDISQAVGLCDGEGRLGEMFVCGTYETGIATIEKWFFSYREREGRKPAEPDVFKTVVYQGTGIGSIAAIEPDPSGRFVFALGYESGTLWRIQRSLEDPLEVVADPTTLAALTTMKSMHRAVHSVEGVKYRLFETPRREWRPWGDDDDPIVVVLHDPDDDGVIDASEAIDRATYEARGYDRWDTWADPCITYH